MITRSLEWTSVFFGFGLLSIDFVVICVCMDFTHSGNRFPLSNKPGAAGYAAPT